MEETFLCGKVIPKNQEIIEYSSCSVDHNSEFNFRQISFWFFSLSKIWLTLTRIPCMIDQIIEFLFNLFNYTVNSKLKKGIFAFLIFFIAIFLQISFQLRHAYWYHLFFATNPAYLFLYRRPVTIFDLIGNAVSPPNFVSVSGWKRKYSCCIWRFSGKSTTLRASNGKVMSTGFSKKAITSATRKCVHY